MRLLAQGATTASQLDQLVVDNRPDLGCLVHDLSDVNQNLGSAPNVGNLDSTLALNWVFFGAVDEVAPTGHAIALTSGEGARDDQEWLRTRLLLPPAEPSAIAYSSPVTLPPILPGAGCDTEFGAGVGPAVQTGFRPSGPDAHVSSPTAQEADVRGGGPVVAPAAPADALVPAPSGTEVPTLALAAVLGLGWLSTLGRRRGRGRCARPVPLGAQVNQVKQGTRAPMNHDMDTTEEPGVAVVGAPKRPTSVGPNARARSRARTMTGTRPADDAISRGEHSAEAENEDGADTDTGTDGTDTGTDTEWSPRSASARIGARRATARPRVVGDRTRTVQAWVAGALGSVAAAALVAAVMFWAAWSEQNNQNAAAAAKAEATNFLLALTNFRPNTIDAQFSSISAMATGQFASQAQNFFGSNIRQALEQARAESDGQIRDIFVQSLSGNQAAVYAVVDQTYANSKIEAPVTDTLRIVVDLTQTSSGWKISVVSVLPAPSASNAPTGNASSAVGGG